MGCILYEMYTGEVLFGLLEEGDHLAMIEKVIGSFSPDQVKQAIAAGVDPSLFADDGRTVWPNADTADSALTVTSTPCPSCTRLFCLQSTTIPRQSLLLTKNNPDSMKNTPDLININENS